MDSLKIFFLAFTQGITELLPISSSGHILLLGNFMDIIASTAFLTSLHIGTTLAIIIFFRKIIIKNLKAENYRSFLLKIVIGSIPTGIIGILFDDYISEQLRMPWITALSLIVWGIVMITVEKKRKRGKTNIKDISIKDSFVIGSAQAIALIPGTSRSGITTITGILLGVEKYTALEFGLILGIPVLLGSSIWSLVKGELVGVSIFSAIGVTDFYGILLILFIPFLMGYLSLMVVSRLKKKNWLTVFGIYRIVIGFLVILLQYWP